MRSNAVKKTLQAGGRSIGTMVFEFASSGLGRIMAGAGAEFAIFDMEHTGWSLETIRSLIASSRCVNLVSLVRVPVGHYHFLARALDVGAQGVMVPMVNSAEEARSIVSACKYPPVGRRGSAFGVAHDDYQGGDLAQKMKQANEEVLIIAQVETAEGVREAERIAAVDGIDLLWVGYFDLTAFLGVPGQFSHPSVLEAVNRVLSACQASGKAAGVLVSSVEEGKAMLELGYRCLAYGGDLWLYQRALREGVTALRAIAGR